MWKTSKFIEAAMFFINFYCLKQVQDFVENFVEKISVLKC